MTHSRPVPHRLDSGAICASKVWVNGKLVLSNEVYHSGTRIDQYIGDCNLAAGEKYRVDQGASKRANTTVGTGLGVSIPIHATRRQRAARGRSVGIIPATPSGSEALPRNPMNPFWFRGSASEPNDSQALPRNPMIPRLCLEWSRVPSMGWRFGSVQAIRSGCLKRNAGAWGPAGFVLLAFQTLEHFFGWLWLDFRERAVATSKEHQVLPRKLVVFLDQLKPVGLILLHDLFL